MPALETFDKLSWHQRHAITDDVKRRCRETSGYDIEDIVRWSCNAYDDRVVGEIIEEEKEKASTLAAEEAYADGRAFGLAEGRAEFEKRLGVSAP